MPKVKIAPSLLSADFLHLSEELKWLNASDAAWLHLDVMDGVFVPNISYGPSIIKQVATQTELFLDVHLMIVEPERYFSAFVDAGAQNISFHLEACTHVQRAIQQIHDLGISAGIVLNPHSNVDLIDDVLEDLDVVLLMSVNPGFGGQKFIYRTLHKIEKLKHKIIRRNLKTKIEVDGGVGLQNAEAIISAGADVLVAGSAIFKSDNPTDTIKQLIAKGNKTI